MFKEKVILTTEKCNFILLAFLPISLLIGTLISEIILNIIVINFLIYSYIKKDWQWLKQPEFKILCIFWLYLVLNFIISSDPMLSISRAIFFIRFIIFIYAVAEILSKKKIEKKIFIFWLLIIITTAFDIYLEFFYGKNIIGNNTVYSGRIASFLGEELKIGHFLYSFYLPIFAYILSLNLEIKKKKYLFSYIILFGIFFIFLAVIITGEKSNSLKASFCLFFFFILSRSYLVQKKIVFIFFLFFLLLFLYFKRGNLPIMGVYQKLNDGNFNVSSYLEGSLHGAHYNAAWEIFKNYPIFGVGNKNFRIECNKEIYYNVNFKFSKERCSTHPHQIYLEFLSELGLLGLLIFLTFLGNILFKSYSSYFKNYNLILLSSILFVCSTFIPLIPGGSFFTSFGATIFWLNIGILIANIKKNK